MARKTPAPPHPVITSLDAFEKGLAAALEVAVTKPESLPGYGASQGNPVNLAPRIPEADAMAAKLVANATNAAENWLAGVQSPRKDPIAAMKASGQKYKNRMAEVLSGDLWMKGVNQIDETEMYNTIKALGSGVFSTGITARKGKITGVFAKLRPLFLALTSQLDGMPTDTDAQREAKMIAARRGMIAIGKKLKGVA
jgi:hypothetical protein